MNRGTPTAVLGAALVAGLLYGCAGANIDLAGIQQYAKTTEAARASFNQIASDFDSTCVAAREYLRYKEFARPPAILRLPPAPAAPPEPAQSPVSSGPVRPTGRPTSRPKPTAAPAPSPQPTPFFKPAGAVATACIGDDDEPVRGDSNDWALANGAILDYVKGLGAIAGIDVTPKNNATLTGGMTALNLITAAQATSINGLITTISSIFAKGAARGQIAGFVQQTSNDFPAATGALLSAADGYSEVLTAECTIMDTYYRQAVVAVRDGAEHLSILEMRDGRPHALDLRITDLNGGSQAPQILWGRQYAIHQIRAQWATEIQACNTKCDSIDAYRKVVKMIAAKQQELAGDVDHGDRVHDLRAVAVSNAQDIANGVSDLYAILFERAPTTTAASKAK